MISVRLACLLLLLSVPVRAQHKLLAVFAHPDDETTVGPLLAHYAGKAQVYLAIATNGDKGVEPFAGIPAGAPLAEARAKEAACACQKLGIHAPILMGFPDGELGNRKILDALVPKMEKLIRDMQPDAIVTWGPDGGYGHPDHRLVSAVVTQVVAEGGVTPLLYYVGLAKSRMTPDVSKALSFLAPFSPTEDRFLNTRIAYTPEDSAKAREALGCHKSQFTTESMDQLHAVNQRMNGGTIYLRLWTGGKERKDIF